MANSIKAIFESHCQGLKIDRRLAKDINRIQVGFVNRHDRDDHLHFFGQGLIGVYSVRYRTEDKDAWLNDLLEVEESDIKEEIRTLPAVDPSWVRATDPVNNSVIWLLHKFYHSSLSTRDKHQVMVDLVLYLHYKFISSLMSHFFPYPADQGVAEDTYRALSNKYHLKQYGSWGKLFEARAEQIISPESVHYNTIVNMDDDTDVVNMISDIQARLREVVKAVTEVFYQVRDNKGGLKSTSAVIEMDDGVEVKDKTSDYSTYIKYIHDIITDRNSFIREELIQVTLDAMHTTPERPLRDTLDYTTKNAGRRGDRNIDKLVDELLLHAYEYLSREKGIMASPSDLPSLITNLRNLYMASRMKDPSLLTIRDLSTRITKKAINSRNEAVIASVRTSLCIYIVLRAFTRNYFQRS